jgi:putative flippase GtrA
MQAKQRPRLPDIAHPAPASRPSLLTRLFSRRAAVLLGRNTVVSTGVFLFGLGLLWLLVEEFAVSPVPAAALSFLASNSLHYIFGRTWIYRGTDRPVAQGYGIFLLNALVGLGFTVALFAAFVALGMHYLVARVVVSIFAGLALLVLNAVLNFRSL